MEDMDKWFKLFDEWRCLKGYFHSNVPRKEQWQLFVKSICKHMNIDKPNWRKLNIAEVSKRIGCSYIDDDGWTITFSGCFALKQLKI